MTFVILGGGAKKLKMSSFLKLCLKSILSYSESFETYLFLGENWVGTPILSHFLFRHFSWNFANFENFYKCLYFSEAKNID